MKCPDCDLGLVQDKAEIGCPKCKRTWFVSSDSGGIALIEKGYFERVEQAEKERQWRKRKGDLMSFYKKLRK